MNKKWRALTTKDKEPYVQQAKDDWERYQNEMKDYLDVPVLPDKTKAKLLSILPKMADVPLASRMTLGSRVATKRGYTIKQQSVIRKLLSCEGKDEGSEEEIEDAKPAAKRAKKHPTKT